MKNKGKLIGFELVNMGTTYSHLSFYCNNLQNGVSQK